MFESILLVTALSIDAFVASIAYGTNKIKIPFASVITINIVCTFLLGISLYLGSIVRDLLPGNLMGYIGVIILFILGVYQLFAGVAKNFINKYLEKDKKVNFQLFNFKFVLEIYVDETMADFDQSRRLNMKEALALALALSMDGLAAGFGTALVTVNYARILLMSLVFHMAAVWLGVWIGGKLAQKAKVNISWLSGAILIGLALFRLVAM